jgi:hypothetical protein
LPKTAIANQVLIEQQPLRLPLKLEERQSDRQDEREKELMPAKAPEFEPAKKKELAVPLKELETEEL